MDDRQLEGTSGTIISSGSGSGDGGSAGLGGQAGDGESGQAGNGGSRSAAGPGSGGVPGVGNTGSSDAGAHAEGAGNGGTTTTGASGELGSGGAEGDGGTGSVATPGCPDLDENGVGDCEETLVGNAGFDSDTDEWTVEPDVSALWDVTDGFRYDESGSLAVSNQTFVDGASGMGMAGASQCITADPQQSYLFLTQVFLDGGQESGWGGIIIWFFDEPGCTGNLKASNAQLVSATGEWFVTYLRMPIPSDTVSMQVRLVAQKPLDQPSFQANFDNVLVRVD